MNFAAFAPHLANPLILVGFVLLLIFGTQRVLIKAGIIPQVDVKTGGKIVLTLLRYGFQIAIVVIVLGFLYAAYTTHLQRVKVVDFEQSIQAIRRQYEARLEESQRSNEITKKQLDDFASTLRELALRSQTDKATNEALEAFLSNDPTKLDKFFLARIEKLETQGKDSIREAAATAVKRGRTFSLSDPMKAFEAFKKATDLDPNNPEAWLGYASTALTLKKYAEAKEGYDNVFKISPDGKFHIDLRLFAISQAGSANVYMREHDFDKAETALNTAILLFDPKTDAHNLLTAYRVRSDVFRLANKPDKAEEDLQRVEKVIAEVDQNDPVTAGQDWYRPLKEETANSRCYLDGPTQKYQVALQSCQKALEGRSNNREVTAGIKYYLALAQMTEKKWQLAEQNLRDAIRDFEEENRGALPLAYANLGVTLINVSNLTDGCFYLDKATDAAASVGDKANAAEITKVRDNTCVKAETTTSDGSKEQKQ